MLQDLIKYVNVVAWWCDIYHSATCAPDALSPLLWMSLSLIYKGGRGWFPYFVKMSRQSFRYHMALMTRIRILVASGSAIHDYDGRNNALGWSFLHCCWNYLGASMHTWELIPRVLTSGLLSYLTGYKANIVQGIRSNQEYLFVVKLAGVVITQQCSNECMGFCLYEI